MIVFTVYGKPQPAGSKKAFQNPKTGRIVVVDDAKGSRPWKQEVTETALDLDAEMILGPVELVVRFFLARPKGHYGTGRNEWLVKASAPPYPAVKPDATKLLRAVEDALTGVLWRDDAQVVRQHVEKHYGTPERVEIAVRELRPATFEAVAA